jgi:uncharacterized protein
MRGQRDFAAACVAVLIAAATLQAQDTTRLRWVPNPRTIGTSWVSDPARHLRPETVVRIDSTISALERETSAELAVVVLDTLDGLEPADAAQLLHRRWGVGKIARDNGLVLLWSPRLRRIQVSVGYGLEGVLTDGRTGRIQDDAMLPHFRRDDFNAGMLAGVQALAAAAREEKYTGPPRARSTSPEMRAMARDASRGGLVAAILGGLGVIVAAMVFVLRRPKKCPRGHGPMRRLGEKEDDVHLEKGAILEEELGSMDYHVWVCATCDETAIVPRRKWVTSYEDCPECKRRTVSKKSKQLRAPTYSTQGEQKVTRKCKNCGWTATVLEVIPKLVRSTSSSGSSGGSSSFGGSSGGGGFGGGSSGGGGAGRSY